MRFLGKNGFYARRRAHHARCDRMGKNARECMYGTVSTRVCTLLYLPVVGGDIVATRDRRPQASCTSAPYCVDSRSIHTFLRVGAPLDPGRSLHSPVTTAPGRGSRVPPSLQDPNPDQSFRLYCPGVPLDGSAVSMSHRHPRCQDFSSGG